MRKLLLVALLMLVGSYAHAQIRAQYVTRVSATTSWTKIYKSGGAKMTTLEIINDAPFSNTDSLYFAMNADTALTRVWPILPGESKFFASIYVDTIRVKASSGTIPARVVVY